MYRCGNKVEIGDCVTVNVSVMVTEMKIPTGTTAVVLETNFEWSSSNRPLVSLLFPDESIQHLGEPWNYIYVSGPACQPPPMASSAPSPPPSCVG